MTESAVRSLAATGLALGAVLADGGGWLQGLAGATVLGGALLAHFWSRLGRLS